MRKSKIAITLLALSLLLGAPSTALADTAYEVYTYDSGNFLAVIFNAMATITGSGMMASMVKIGLLVGLLTALLSYPGFEHRFGGHEEAGLNVIRLIVTKSVATAVIVGLLMTHRVNVMITDRMDPSQTQVVSNVPFLPAVVAWGSSTFGDYLGSELDDLITDVDDIKLRNSGMAGGARYLNDVLDIGAPGAPADYGGNGYTPINMVLGEYWTRCIFNRFGAIPGEDSEEAKGLRSLMSSPWLMGAFPGAMYNNVNIVFNSQFVAGDPPDGTACSNANAQIMERWRAVFTPWLSQFSCKVFGSLTGDPGDPCHVSLVQAMFERYFGWNDNVQDWTDNVIQLAVINAIRTEALFFNQAWGGSGAGESVMEKKVGEGWIYTARLFNKIVLIIRQLAEALIYTSAIFLPVLVAVSGLKYFFLYFKMNLWLQLWIPIFVVLNAFADKQLISVLNAAMNNSAIANGNNGISFANVEWIRTHANLILGYIGAFSWSVPTLSWALLQGVEYAMKGAVGAITEGGGGQSVAQGVGSEVGGGGKPQMAPISQNPTLTNVRNAWGMTADIPGMTGQTRLGFDFGSDLLERYSQIPYYEGAGKLDAVGGNLDRLRGASTISTGRQLADQRAFAEEAHKRGSSVEELQKNFAEMDYGGKAQVIQDWQQKHGGTLQEAAQSLAAITGDRHFVEAERFRGGREAAGGVQNLASLQESAGKIETSALFSTVETMRDYGFSEEDFGGAKGFLEAARTVAFMEDVKGGRLTQGELVAAQATGFLTETGRAQGIERAASDLGMNPKELTKKIAGWGNLQEFIKFNEMQRFADSRGVDLKQLMSAQHRGAEVSVSDEEAGKLGLPGHGQYRLAWDQDQGYVFYQQKEGADRQVGTFGRFGTVREVFNKSVEDYQNVKKDGSLRETVDKTVLDTQDVNKAGSYTDRTIKFTPDSAFQMARLADHNLVSDLVKSRHNPEMKDAAIYAVSSSLGEGISKYLQEQGMFVDQARASGGISSSGALWGNFVQKLTGLHGEAGINVEDTYRENAQLTTQRIDKLTRETITEANEQRFDDYETSELLSSRLQKHVGSIYEKAQKMDLDTRGAIAPIAGVGKELRNISKNPVEDNPPEFGLMSPR